MLKTKDLTPDQDGANSRRGCSGEDCSIAQGCYKINRQSKKGASQTPRLAPIEKSGVTSPPL